MLNADSNQGTSNSVIVSQVQNSHAPQDFTVSRLLSTPNHTLGEYFLRKDCDNSGLPFFNYYILSNR